MNNYTKGTTLVKHSKYKINSSIGPSFIVLFFIFLSGCATTSEQKELSSTITSSIDKYRVSLNDDDIKPPGYFDVGAGFGVIQRKGPDVKGLLVSFKGYPYGRWYTKKKKPNPVEITKLTQEVNSECSVTNPPNNECQKSKEAKTVELEKKISSLYNISGEYKEIRERSKWWNRLSVFYAMSPENFDGGELDTSVDAMGIGLDITPELSLIVGGATYENTDGGVSNDYVFGVSLNLNAFNFLNGL